MLCQACVTREEIEVAIWKTNTPIPPEICSKVEQLQHYGFYRVLNSGQLEFISYCNKESKNFFGMHKTDFENLINKATVPDEN